MRLLGGPEAHTVPRLQRLAVLITSLRRDSGAVTQAEGGPQGLRDPGGIPKAQRRHRGQTRGGWGSRLGQRTLSSRRQLRHKLSVCAMAVLRNRRGLWGSELTSSHGPSKAGELGACLLRHQAFQKPPPSRRLLKGLVHQRTSTQLPRDQNPGAAQMKKTANSSHPQAGLRGPDTPLASRDPGRLAPVRAVLATGLKRTMPIRTVITREVNAWPPSFKGQTFGLDAKTAGDFNLKPIFIYHSENPRSLMNHAKSTLPVPYKWNNQV
ncbi:hypothetical protein QTO34_005277 [Cnephaeus nilssonii]|uniref:Uncharacterized protein n=1 Tax=Cnephaeus nilssonii TaxID=3371016 RepID=A0AA40LJP4_CNENI|nr:hypothetical protein QTO34_005277 [Eptesicus nilssonii]